MGESLLSNARLKPADKIRPKPATARSPAIRDMALLTPEATPASLNGTDPITAVVSGATLIAIPRPRTITGGKKVLQ